MLDARLQSPGLSFHEETKGYGVLDHSLDNVEGEVYAFCYFDV